MMLEVAGKRGGMSTAGGLIIVLVLVLSVAAIAYLDDRGTASANSQQIARLQSELSSLQRNQSTLLSNLAQKTGAVQQALGSLPIMNQTTTIRTIRETWYLSPQAHQDRFDPAFVVVNQGDTVRLTLIDNDTVAHDFVIGPPYNIVVNATVPGLINDLTGQTFKTASKNNSPGVVVRGTPGNVSATYSFVTKFPGIFEFVCTYHAQVGMIGYLVVLPNEAYAPQQKSSTLGSTPSSAQVKVNIVAGAGSNTSSKGYYPNTVTLVLGVNNTIAWINNDSSPHTVTANDGTFESANLAPTAFFTFTFTRPGTYGYHCVYHPWMVGTVVVKAKG